MLDDTKRFARQVLADPLFSEDCKRAWQHVLDEIARYEAEHPGAD